MQVDKLHIVSFDVPFPPDYGGAIDVFYKVKSLYEAGCTIYLHCYEYGRGQAAELEKYCKEVYYYRRNTGISGISLSVPYIVCSRRNNDLLKNLQYIDAPILFEGVHTTYFLSHHSLQDRYKAIRTHNVEHEYYQKLADKESAFFKRTYFKTEAGLLKKYEASLHGANAILSLSMADNKHFSTLYPNAKNYFVPPFHPYNEVNSATGSGTYCLYHGNLSHPENRETAFFLLKDVIPFTETKFIIAGKKPAPDLVAACNSLPNCKLIADPGSATMDDLIAQAQVHVLPAFQQTGMKLKLLSALYGGRHVLVNEAMLYGTGLNSACHIADSSKAFVNKINELMRQPFTEQDKTSRAEQLIPYNKSEQCTTATWYYEYQTVVIYIIKHLQRLSLSPGHVLYVPHVQDIFEIIE